MSGLDARKWQPMTINEYDKDRPHEEGIEQLVLINSSGYVSGMKLGNGFDESNFVGNRPAPYTTPMKKHNRGIIDDKLEELHQPADKISDE